jgi:hypothetical protein
MFEREEDMDEYVMKRSKITAILQSAIKIVEALVRGVSSILKKTPPPPPPSKMELFRKKMAVASSGVVSVVADQVRELAPNITRLIITIALECTSFGRIVQSNRVLSTTARFMGF